MKVGINHNFSSSTYRRASKLPSKRLSIKVIITIHMKNQLSRQCQTQPSCSCIFSPPIGFIGEHFRNIMLLLLYIFSSPDMLISIIAQQQQALFFSACCLFMCLLILYDTHALLFFFNNICQRVKVDQ